VTPDEPGTDSPETGDNSTVYVTLAVVLMALAAAAAFITSKKRA
jgi:LPXTG-motif cell wall-anchored protein